MKTCLVDDLIIPENRQRRDFDMDAMQELMSSIQDSAHGLLHPVVIRRVDGKAHLVAGERRLRAITEIYELGGNFTHGADEETGLPLRVPVGQVPIVDLGELLPLAAFEAELEENIRRKDLTVLEAAQATAKLYELRGMQAEVVGAPKPTAGDIAREVFDLPASKPSGELGSAQAKIKHQLLVAKHSANPEVRKATSLKEAVNIIKKADQVSQNQRLVETVGKIYSTANLSLLNEDTREYCTNALNFGQFDIILTDPPYGMGADQFSDSGAGSAAGAHTYDDSYESWLELMKVFVPATFNLTKAEAHAYIFCDIDRFPELRAMMAKAGWDVHRTPIIWHNPDGFRAPWPDSGPQRKYELILYAKKGGKKTIKLAPDIIVCRKDAATGHPAQKPVELLKDLLSRSAGPGSKVFDGFAGSGATLEACHSMLLDCTALEKDKTHYGTALNRVKALSVNDEGLF